MSIVPCLIIHLRDTGSANVTSSGAGFSLPLVPAIHTFCHLMIQSAIAESRAVAIAKGASLDLRL